MRVVSEVQRRLRAAARRLAKAKQLKPTLDRRTRNREHEWWRRMRKKFGGRLTLEEEQLLFDYRMYQQWQTQQRLRHGSKQAPKKKTR